VGTRTADSHDGRKVVCRQGDSVVVWILPSLAHVVQSRIEVLEAQISQLRHALDDSSRAREADMAAAGFRAPADARTIRAKETQRLNEDLIATIAQQDAAVTASREECNILRELTADAQRGRALAEAQCLSLSQRVRGLTHRVAVSREEKRALQHRYTREFRLVVQNPGS
jgi:hypothetical protein